jgi:hypothetical protein
MEPTLQDRTEDVISKLNSLLLEIADIGMDQSEEDVFIYTQRAKIKIEDAIGDLERSLWRKQ